MRVSSRPNSSEAKRVCLPMAWAATWSADTPAKMSEPDSRGWAPVKKLAEARAWSPGPEPRALALWHVKWDRTSVCSRNRSSGRRMGVNAKSFPCVAGVQLRMTMPLGT